MIMPSCVSVRKNSRAAVLAVVHAGKLRVTRLSSATSAEEHRGAFGLSRYGGETPVEHCVAGVMETQKSLFPFPFPPAERNLL